MKEKTLSKLLSLAEKIKNTDDPQKIKKYWETFFNLALHNLGYKPKTRKMLFKNYRKVIFFDTTEIKGLTAETLKKMIVKAIESHYQNVSLDHVFGIHIIYIYLMKAIKQELNGS